MCRTLQGLVLSALTLQSVLPQSCKWRVAEVASTYGARG